MRKNVSMAFIVIMVGMFIAISSCSENKSASNKTGTTVIADNSEHSPIISEETAKCISCHGEKDHGKVIVEDWKQSRHSKVGVGCLSCHQAGKDDVDGFDHEGYHIATVVSPNDCATCHPSESKEFQHSYHADAGMIMGSLDNVLAEVVEGHVAFNDGSNPAAAAGCWQCHGSKVTLLKDKSGKVLKDENGIPQYDPKTWPNTGIGRINLDGSKGSCSACHSRHKFSVAQVRQPENCGKCHMGPDHPQIEIYEESKHGINFHAFKDQMNLDSKKWVVGEDYSASATCATCHMSATPNQPITHDVGARISWTLRPKVSEKIDASQLKKFKARGEKVPEGFLKWDQRRDNMKDVCSQCHEENFINGFYTQFDNEVNLYNEKFGKPALNLMKVLKKDKLITSVPFDEKIEWTYFLLWHHEGRRARHGAAMMAPDYTQWHGNFEVAERFYTEFVPEIQEIIREAKLEGKATANIEKALNDVLNSEMHKWYLGKLSSEEVQKRKEAAKKYRSRYSSE